MKEYYDLVCEFHDKYGQYRRGGDGPGPIPITVVMLRTRLMIEELGEANEALDVDDVLGIADGLGDFAYVVAGTLVAYGLEPPSDHDCELLWDNSENLTLEGGLGSVVTHMHEYLVAREPDPKRLENIGKGLVALLCDIRHMMKTMNMPFDAIFREIHSSNMTKAVPGEGSPVTGAKYGAKLGAGGKGHEYRPPNLLPLLEGVVLR